MNRWTLTCTAIYTWNRKFLPCRTFAVFFVFIFVLGFCFVLFFRLYSYQVPQTGTARCCGKCFKVFRQIQKHHQKYEANRNKMLKYVLCIENGVHDVCMHGGWGVRISSSVVKIFQYATRTHTPTNRIWWYACDRPEPQNLINNFSAGMFYSCLGRFRFARPFVPSIEWLFLCWNISTQFECLNRLSSIH